MQSKQLSTTPVASSRRVQDCLTTEAARAAYPAIEQALQYGTEWLWNGTGPVLTAQGLRVVAANLQAGGTETDAAAVLALRDTLLATAPAPATVRAMHPVRSHLPYADADDAQIFATLAAEHSNHADLRHH